MFRVRYDNTGESWLIIRLHSARRLRVPTPVIRIDGLSDMCPLIVSTGRPHRHHRLDSCCNEIFVWWLFVISVRVAARNEPVILYLRLTLDEIKFAQLDDGSSRIMAWRRSHLWRLWSNIGSKPLHLGQTAAKLHHYALLLTDRRSSASALGIPERMLEKTSNVRKHTYTGGGVDFYVRSLSDLCHNSL